MVQNFSFDGTQSRTQDDTGGGELSSRAKWHKSTLIIEGSDETSVGDRNVDMHFKEELSLSKDGKTLTVKTTRQTPRGLMSTKQTFQKS